MQKRQECRYFNTYIAILAFYFHLMQPVTFYKIKEDYQWQNFCGITTGKTVDSSGKTVVIPLISIVISVDNSGNNTKFYH